jgi:hypothetical protein
LQVAVVVVRIMAEEEDLVVFAHQQVLLEVVVVLNLKF